MLFRISPYTYWRKENNLLNIITETHIDMYGHYRVKHVTYKNKPQLLAAILWIIIVKSINGYVKLNWLFQGPKNTIQSRRV